MKRTINDLVFHYFSFDVSHYVLIVSSFQFKGTTPSKYVLILSIAIAFLAIAARRIMLKKKDHSYQGSVADLVRRGQLRSDRRGM